MSELNSTLNFLEASNEIKNPPTDNLSKDYLESINEEELKIFDIQQFGQELYNKSEEKNRRRAMKSNQNITGYDISRNCIQQILYKLRNTPIENYADSWLPIYLRTEVGSAIHSFLQNNTHQFTETEVHLKVPSLRFYGKIDYLINNNLLGEIKTCTYADYKTIINHQKPRDKDFLQAFCYYYILTNYLKEIKDDSIEIYKGDGDKPKLNQYNIQKLQFIYIAHDIISSDAESYAEMLECVKSVKKTLSSKKNPFFFITSIVVDLTEPLIQHFSKYVKDKFEDIHHYLKTKTSPDENSRFIIKDCFFCPYKTICGFSK